MKSLLAFSAGLLLLAACSSASRDGFVEPGPTGETPPGPGEEFEQGGASPAGPVGSITGTVLAPNGEIPIAGALVYLTKTRPEPNPEGVYCDGCVRLSASTPYAVADASGKFELLPNATGTHFLVVQKGGFRRIREISVNKGKATLSGPNVTLPGKTDRAKGDEVPKMTVVHGAYDDIEASLVKLGVDPSAFEIVQSALIGQAAKAFLTDRARVMGAHIVFLPCGDFTQPPPNTDLSADADVQRNLQDFVRAGGRLYTTDWHYDFVARAFPGHVSWVSGGGTACSGCGRTAYDAAASVEDPGLSAWLSAQSLSNFTLQRNYTTIASVNAVASTDADGNPKTVTPKVWVKGSKTGGAATPATVTFEAGCGRVLFSTYHTEPSTLALTPQERTLLGVLLETTVCNESPTGVVVR
ncbi:MAG: hypothetical protein JST00_38120 [Deltaproteobacteria bacterium]|nr:hypothetical protein [Deltaproteobacteria bacterium]